MRCILAAAVAAVLVVSSGAAKYGIGCEIRNAEFTNEYLYLTDDWTSLNPLLLSVRPQSASRHRYGKWRVERASLRTMTLFKLQNSNTAEFLVANGGVVGTRSFVSKGDESELVWKMEERSGTVTLQQNGKFLSAKKDKYRDERGVLMAPNSNKNTARWIINCCC